MINIKFPQLDILAKDLEKLPLIVIGERGAGKSTSVKSLVKYMTQTNGYCFKIFDPSLVWLINPPLKHVKRVTGIDIMRDRIRGKCGIYLTAELSIPDRRCFMASIIAYDYSKRVDMIFKRGHKALNNEPIICYVIEESQCVIGSYALRSRSPVVDVIKDFISVGRNIGGINDVGGQLENGLTGIFTTQRISEVSTEVVERCNLLCGKTMGHRNLQKIRSATNMNFKRQVEKLKRYQWIYFNGATSKVFSIPPVIPEIHKLEVEEKPKRSLLARILRR